MSRHTPGTWSVLKVGKEHWQVCAFGQTSSYLGEKVAIAEVCMWDGEPLNGQPQSNASLIAAAPDLLEALEMVRDADEDCKKVGLPTIPEIARAKIDSAIHKAEGRIAAN